VSFFSKGLLLFLLNFLDAQLTIIWVRAGLATEANHLMAWLLDRGNAPFLSVKLLVGFLSAYILWRFSHLRIAQRGLKVALSVYVALMFVHALTGLSAIGGAETALTLLSLPRSPLYFLL
jgi:hypothetical protein